REALEPPVSAPVVLADPGAVDLQLGDRRLLEHLAEEARLLLGQLDANHGGFGLDHSDQLPSRDSGPVFCIGCVSLALARRLFRSLGSCPRFRPPRSRRAFVHRLPVSWGEPSPASRRLPWVRVPLFGCRGPSCCACFYYHYIRGK